MMARPSRDDPPWRKRVALPGLMALALATPALVGEDVRISDELILR